MPSAPLGLPRLAAGLAIWSAVAVVVSLQLARGSGQSWSYLVQQHALIGAVVGISFTGVGAFVLAREPRHTLAWIFVAIGQSETFGLLASAWVVRHPELPGADAATLVADVVWMPGFVLAALSEKTVRNHVSAILAKLHAADRAEAGARARAAGLGTPGGPGR